MPKKPAPKRNLPQPPRQQARPVTPQMRTGTKPQALQPWQRQGLQRAQATGDPSSYLQKHPGVLRNQALQQMQQLRRPTPRPPVPGQAGGNMAGQMGVGQQPQPQMPLGGYQQPPQQPYPPPQQQFQPQPMLGGSGGWGMAGGNMGNVGFGQQGNQWSGGMGPFGMAGGNMGAYFGGGQQGGFDQQDNVIRPQRPGMDQWQGQAPTQNPYNPGKPSPYGNPGGMAGGNMNGGVQGLLGQVNPGMQSVIANRLQPPGLSAGQQRRFQAGQAYMNAPPQQQAGRLPPLNAPIPQLNQQNEYNG